MYDIISYGSRVDDASVDDVTIYDVSSLTAFDRHFSGTFRIDSACLRSPGTVAGGFLEGDVGMKEERKEG